MFISLVIVVCPEQLNGLSLIMWFYSMFVYLQGVKTFEFDDRGIFNLICLL